MFLVATTTTVQHIPQVNTDTSSSRAYHTCSLLHLIFHILDMLLVFTPDFHSSQLRTLRNQENRIRQFLQINSRLQEARLRNRGTIKLIFHRPVSPIVRTRPMVIVGMDKSLLDRHMILRIGNDTRLLCHHLHEHHECHQEPYNQSLHNHNF